MHEYKVEGSIDPRRPQVKTITVQEPLSIGDKVYIQTPQEQCRFKVVNIIHTVIQTQMGNSPDAWYSPTSPYGTLE